MGGYGFDNSGSWDRHILGTCGHCNKPSGFIQCKEFLTSWGVVSHSGRTLPYGVCEFVGQTYVSALTCNLF